MRYFFRRRIPPLNRVLLVESGSRHLAEYLLPILRRDWDPGLIVDLVTCYSGLPAGFPPEARTFPIQRYRGRAGRSQLYGELRSFG